MADVTSETSRFFYKKEGMPGQLLYCVFVAGNTMWKIVFATLAAVLAVGSGNTLGGLRDIDVNDDDARDVLNFAVDQHNKRINDLCPHQVEEVERVQSQVVAGMKYIINVRMVRTPCRKVCASDDLCAIQEDAAKAKIFQCEFTVWSRPWLQEISLLEEKCS